ncbi:MAG: VanZ family protein [Myxococcota bacterium]
MIRVIPMRGLAALVYMAGVLTLSALPGRQIARWGFSSFTLDLLHIPLFAGLGLVTMWAIAAPRAQRAILVGTGIVLFAGVDEILQLWVPGRAASFADFLRDTLGIAIGIGLAIGMRPVALALRGESER